MRWTAVILALVACGGKDSDDTGSGSSSSAQAWCDLSAFDVCWNFLLGSAVQYSTQYPQACDEAGGEYHGTGECPRDDTLGCCLVNDTWEYVWYATDENVANQDEIQSDCAALSGTWGPC